MRIFSTIVFAELCAIAIFFTLVGSFLMFMSLAYGDSSFYNHIVGMLTG